MARRTARVLGKVEECSFMGLESSQYPLAADCDTIGCMLGWHTMLGGGVLTMSSSTNATPRLQVEIQALLAQS